MAGLPPFSQPDLGVLLAAMQYRLTLLNNTLANPAVANALAAFSDVTGGMTTGTAAAVQYSNIIGNLETLIYPSGAPSGVTVPLIAPTPSMFLPRTS